MGLWVQKKGHCVLKGEEGLRSQGEWSCMYRQKKARDLAPRMNFSDYRRVSEPALYLMIEEVLGENILVNSKLIIHTLMAGLKINPALAVVIQMKILTV